MISCKFDVGSWLCEYATLNGVDVRQKAKATPNLNWSDMPAWANFVAMDKNGAWWTYVGRPRHSMRMNPEWAGGGFATKVHPDYYPQFSGSWENSLVERPKS